MKAWVASATLLLPAPVLVAGDAIESPFVLPAGSWLIEVDALRWSRDKSGGNTTETRNVGDILAARGLSSTVELQLVFQPHVRIATNGPGERTTITGHGDVDLRANIVLHGDEENGFGLSALPYVSLPIGENGIGREDWGAGLIIPAAWTLSPQTVLGAMAGLDLERNGRGRNFDTLFFAAVSLDTWYTENLAGYVEVTAERPWADGAAWATSLNLGGTVVWSEGMELTAGYNFGLSSAANDREAYVRLAFSW